QVADLTQRTAGGRHDRIAGRRQRGKAFALAHEDAHTELVFQLPDLFRDAGLRRVQRFGGIGDVEPVVDDRAEVAQLLKVQRPFLNAKCDTKGCRLESTGIIARSKRSFSDAPPTPERWGPKGLKHGSILRDPPRQSPAAADPR